MLVLHFLLKLTKTTETFKEYYSAVILVNWLRSLFEINQIIFFPFIAFIQLKGTGLSFRQFCII